MNASTIFTEPNKAFDDGICDLRVRIMDISILHTPITFRYIMTNEERHIKQLEFELSLRKESLATGREILIKATDGSWVERGYTASRLNPEFEYKLADPEPEPPKELWIGFKGEKIKSAANKKHDTIFKGLTCFRYIHEDEVKKIAVDCLRYHCDNPNYPVNPLVLKNREKSFDRFMEGREG